MKLNVHIAINLVQSKQKKKIINKAFKKPNIYM